MKKRPSTNYHDYSQFYGKIEIKALFPFLAKKKTTNAPTRLKCSGNDLGLAEITFCLEMSSEALKMSFDCLEMKHG